MILIPHPPESSLDRALWPTKVVFIRSKASSNLFTKRIDAVGPAPFMRLSTLSTEGVATEHHWLDELGNSPLARLVFCETRGANRRLKPAWLHSLVPGMVAETGAGFCRRWAKQKRVPQGKSSDSYGSRASAQQRPPWCKLQNLTDLELRLQT